MRGSHFRPNAIPAKIPLGDKPNERNQPMKLNVTIPIEQYKQLIHQSEMLRRIAAVVVRYARTPTTTTYECVVKLGERERKMSAKIQAHKNLGGKFLGSKEANEPMTKPTNQEQ
jgi:hypothetical protein